MLVLITSEFGALAAALVVADLGDLSVAGLFLTLWGGSIAGLVAARVWWRSLTDTWRGGIHYLLDQLTRTTNEVLSSKHAPAEVAPPEPRGLRSRPEDGHFVRLEPPIVRE